MKEKEHIVEGGEGTAQPVPEQHENSQQPDKKRKFPVALLYVRGMSEDLRIVFSTLGTPAYMKPINTLRPRGEEQGGWAYLQGHMRGL